MKIDVVLRAQSIGTLRPNIFASVPIFDLVEGLQERYSFKQIPTTQELVNPLSNQPANFIWAKKKIGDRTVTVESLQVQNFPNLATTAGVITRTSTDDAELVLNDLSQWVHAQFNLDVTPVFPRTFQSQLELTMEGDLQNHFSFLRPIGKILAEIIKDYGFSACPTYEPYGFNMYFDNTKATTPPTLATAFSLERRVGAAFEENKYFSQAPLRTQDHEEVLRRLERVLVD